MLTQRPWFESRLRHDNLYGRNCTRYNSSPAILSLPTEYTFTCFIHYTHKLYIQNSQPKNLQRYLNMVSWHTKFKWPGLSPYSRRPDPLHSKLNIEYECWYKMVQKKVANYFLKNQNLFNISFFQLLLFERLFWVFLI